MGRRRVDAAGEPMPQMVRRYNAKNERKTMAAMAEDIWGTVESGRERRRRQACERLYGLSENQPAETAAPLAEKTVEVSDDHEEHQVTQSSSEQACTGRAQIEKANGTPVPAKSDEIADSSSTDASERQAKDDKASVLDKRDRAVQGASGQSDGTPREVEEEVAIAHVEQPEVADAPIDPICGDEGEIYELAHLSLKQEKVDQIPGAQDCEDRVQTGQTDAPPASNGCALVASTSSENVHERREEIEVVQEAPVNENPVQTESEPPNFTNESGAQCGQEHSTSVTSDQIDEVTVPSEAEMHAMAQHSHTNTLKEHEPKETIETMKESVECASPQVCPNGSSEEGTRLAKGDIHTGTQSPESQQTEKKTDLLDLQDEQTKAITDAKKKKREKKKGKHADNQSDSAAAEKLSQNESISRDKKGQKADCDRGHKRNKNRRKPESDTGHMRIGSTDQGEAVDAPMEVQSLSASPDRTVSEEQLLLSAGPASPGANEPLHESQQIADASLSADGAPAVDASDRNMNKSPEMEQSHIRPQDTSSQQKVTGKLNVVCDDDYLAETPTLEVVEEEWTPVETKRGKRKRKRSERKSESEQKLHADDVHESEAQAGTTTSTRLSPEAPDVQITNMDISKQVIDLSTEVNSNYTESSAPAFLSKEDANGEQAIFADKSVNDAKGHGTSSVKNAEEAEVKEGAILDAFDLLMSSGEGLSEGFMDAPARDEKIEENCAHDAVTSKRVGTSEERLDKLPPETSRTMDAFDLLMSTEDDLNKGFMESFETKETTPIGSVVIEEKTDAELNDKLGEVTRTPPDSPTDAFDLLISSGDGLQEGFMEEYEPKKQITIKQTTVMTGNTDCPDTFTTSKEHRNGDETVGFQHECNRSPTTVESESNIIIKSDVPIISKEPLTGVQPVGSSPTTAVLSGSDIDGGISEHVDEICTAPKHQSTEHAALNVLRSEDIEQYTKEAVLTQEKLYELMSLSEKTHTPNTIIDHTSGKTNKEETVNAKREAEARQADEDLDKEMSQKERIPDNSNSDRLQGSGKSEHDLDEKLILPGIHDYASHEQTWYDAALYEAAEVRFYERMARSNSFNCKPDTKSAAVTECVVQNRESPPTVIADQLEEEKSCAEMVSHSNSELPPVAVQVQSSSEASRNTAAGHLDEEGSCVGVAAHPKSELLPVTLPAQSSSEASRTGVTDHINEEEPCAKRSPQSNSELLNVAAQALPTSEASPPAVPVSHSNTWFDKALYATAEAQHYETLTQKCSGDGDSGRNSSSGSFPVYEGSCDHFTAEDDQATDDEFAPCENAVPQNDSLWVESKIYNVTDAIHREHSSPEVQPKSTELAPSADSPHPVAPTQMNAAGTTNSEITVVTDALESAPSELLQSLDGIRSPCSAANSAASPLSPLSPQHEPDDVYFEDVVLAGRQSDVTMAALRGFTASPLSEGLAPGEQLDSLRTEPDLELSEPGTADILEDGDEAAQPFFYGSTEGAETAVTVVEEARQEIPPPVLAERLSTPELKMEIPTPGLTEGLQSPRLDDGLPSLELKTDIPAVALSTDLPSPTLAGGIPLSTIGTGIGVPEITTNIPPVSLTAGISELAVTSEMLTPAEAVSTTVPMQDAEETCKPVQATIASSPVKAIKAPEPVQAIAAPPPVQAIKASEPVQAIAAPPPVEAIQAAEPVQAIAAPPLVHAIKASEPVQAIAAPPPVQAIKASEPVQAIAAPPPVHAIKASEPVHAIAAPPPVHAIKASEPVHSIAAPPPVEAIQTAEPVQAIAASPPVEAINAAEPVIVVKPATPAQTIMASTLNQATEASIATTGTNAALSPDSDCLAPNSTSTAIENNERPAQGIEEQKLEPTILHKSGKENNTDLEHQRKESKESKMQVTSMNPSDTQTKEVNEKLGLTDDGRVSPKESDEEIISFTGQSNPRSPIITKKINRKKKTKSGSTKSNATVLEKKPKIEETSSAKDDSVTPKASTSRTCATTAPSTIESIATTAPPTGDTPAGTSASVVLVTVTTPASDASVETRGNEAAASAAVDSVLTAAEATPSGRLETRPAGRLAMPSHPILADRTLFLPGDEGRTYASLMQQGADMLPARPVFHAHACHVCNRLHTKQHRLKSCGSCRLVAYCSAEHQRAHWPLHRALCRVITRRLRHLGTQHLYREALNVSAPQQWKRIRFKHMAVCEEMLDRPMEPYEKEMFLYPRACDTCHETNPERLRTCTACHSVSFCCDAHLRKTHAKFCKDLRLLLDIHSHQNVHGVCAPPLPDTVLAEYAPLPPHIREFLVVSMLGPQRALQMGAVELAVLSECASYPLTLLYALQNIPVTEEAHVSRLERLTVHVVGAEFAAECEPIARWDVFLLNVLPRLRRLHVVFVGSELEVGDGRPGVTEQDFTCRPCLAAGKRFTCEFQPNTAYHTYCRSPQFRPPHVVCAFNAGLHRHAGHESRDTWRDSLPHLVRDGVPLVLTGYTLLECPQDVARVQQEQRVDVLLPPMKNPYRSTRPLQNFLNEHEAPLVFKNQYVACLMAAGKARK